MIRAFNRTNALLKQLFDTTNVENVDLILTLSPMLLQHLQERQKLTPFNDAPAESQNSTPESTRVTSVAIIISGFGLPTGCPAPSVKHLPASADRDDLALPTYQDALLVSSPSRSDTNYLMVESLLQQRDWVKGWEALLTSAGNLVTISPHDFGIADKVKSGLGVAGPVIDNYANLLLDNLHISSTYFPRSTVFPIYIAILRKSPHTDTARHFIHRLLSPKGQRILADANTGKCPVTPLVADNPRAIQQQFLMNQPPLSYHLILKRQRLVQHLFDTAISFRFIQLKDVWRALHSIEVRLKKPLPEIRALLTQMPVVATSSEDPVWLARFDNKSFTEQQVMERQLWFLNNQRLAIKKLEELKRKTWRCGGA